MLKWFVAASLAVSAMALSPMAARAEADWRSVDLAPMQKKLSRRHNNSDKSPIPRETVRYEGGQPAGTIIVNTSERRLYYTLGDGKAIKYGVGVGKEGFAWAGANRISRKAEWPGWTPPPQMIRREAAKGRKLPPYMEGGPNNPLGARALYIGSTLYRIHGTNQPWTIGQAMSSGCIRMANEDVVHLAEQVEVGTRVIVIR